jgi:glycosyltransferase involved in cell wall biosynthesis
MRIVLASTAVNLGGVWRHMSDLGLALHAAGVDVTIGLLPAAIPVQEAASRVGLPWKPLHRTLGRGVDVWHVHLSYTYDRTAFLALTARRLLGPSVITEHLPRSDASDSSLESHHPRTPGATQAKTWFKRAQYALVDEVIAVSRGSAQFLERRYGLSGGTVTLVHNGVKRPDTCAAPRKPVSPLHVLVLGNLGWQKGVDVLLEAARRSNSQWKVKVVGDGGHIGSLQETARTLPVGRIEFAGWTDDPGSHLAAADVVCMPSRWESFPYTALEASASCRPVVASRVDGLDEIVIDGVTGLLVNPDDPGALAAALDRLSAEPILVTEFGQAARTRAQSFTIDDMLRSTLLVYERAIERRRGTVRGSTFADPGSRS